VMNETSVKRILSLPDPGEEVSDEEHRVAAAIEEQALSLPDEEWTLH